MLCTAKDRKVVLKDVQHVCHSVGWHISDVVAIRWYCDQWTSETSRTTHLRLPVSAVPHLLIVTAIGNTRCCRSPHTACSIRFKFKSGLLAGHIADSVVFDSVRRRAVLLQKHVLSIFLSFFIYPATDIKAYKLNNEVVWIHFSCVPTVNIII